MNYDALQRYQPLEARAIAAAALRKLLEVEHRNLDYIPQVDAKVGGLIKEMAAKARADVAALSSTTRMKLLNLATEAVRSVAIGDPKPADTKSKIGTLGLMRSADYKIHLTDLARGHLPYIGLRSKDVETAIKEADAQQHLFPPDGFHDSPFVSLFVRLLNREVVASQGAKADWCLVVANRAGQRLNVMNAWRIFEKDVQLESRSASPIDLLKALANAFGSPVVVGQKNSHLVVYERLPAGSALIQANNLPADSVLEFGFRINPDGSMALEVTVAYAIDMTKYMAALRSHGVDLPRRFKR